MIVSHFAVFFALAVNFQHVRGLMVKLADGSFAPWSFAVRDSGGLPVKMNNNHDLAYLVSYIVVLVCFPLIGYRQPSRWVGSLFRLVTRSHSIVTLCDRNACSADPNGRFSFAELCLSGIASGRCQRPVVVRMFVNLDIQSPDVFGLATTQLPLQVTPPLTQPPVSRPSQEQTP